MQSTQKRSYTPRQKKQFVCDWCAQNFMSAALNGPKFCGSKCQENARYARDRDKRLAAAKKFREGNRDEISRRRKAAWAAAPEKGRKQNRDNYVRHREKRIAYARTYQKARPDVTARTRNKRRAALSFDVTSSDLAKVIHRYDGKCAYCCVTLTKFGRSSDTSGQWDHVVPLSRGGSDGIGNIVPACRKCNGEKNAKFQTEWRDRWYARAGSKPGADELIDLQKAAWYVDREIRRITRQKETKR